MPSERRLHPLSLVFNIGQRFGAMAIPLMLIVIGRGTDDDWWSVYAIAVLVPYTGFVVGRYLTFRYRYEPGELVIREGLFFRNQRHIPYDRIQNIDAVQNLFHRITSVVEVRVQTGGGSEPEATLSVLSLADLEEMRRRVFAGAWRESAASVEGEPAAAPAQRTLLHLPPGELVVYALIENRGFVIIAAAFGLLSEYNIAPGLTERLFGEEANGFFRNAGRSMFVEGRMSPRIVLFGLAGLLAFLVVSRMFSIIWAIVRLGGYRVTRAGEDLRAEYGLFTRITATVPIRRIQAVTIRDTPLHRLLGRASISVATAGGMHGEHEKTPQHREWIAPIIRRGDIPAFLSSLLPGVDLSALDWQPVHPNALRRSITRGTVVSSLLTLVLAAFAGKGAFWLLAVLLPWTVVRSILSIRYLRWAITPHVVAARHGALVHVLSVAPLARIQAVEQAESPFDRFARMRTVSADTAGRGSKIHVPYLGVDTAAELYGQLAAAAAHTEFRW